MATMFPGIDSEELRRLLAQYQTTPDDKRQALGLGLLSGGLAMMGARRGQEFNALAQAGLLGVGNYRGALQDAQEQKLGAMRGAMGSLQLQQALQSAKDDAGVREALGAMTAPPSPAAGMPSLAPTVANAAALQQRTAAAGDPFTRYMQYADQLDAAAQAQRNPKLAAQAEQYREKALKFRDENQGFEVQMVNGQPVTVQRKKYGAPEVLSGMAPKPDMQILTLGDRSEAVDKLRIQPGQTWQQGVSPDTVYTGDITKRGQNMVDARSRETLAQQAAAGQIVETPTGYARIGKDNTVTPIVADGTQVQGKPTGAVQQQIATNAVTLGKIDRALTLVEKNPDAFGLKNVIGDQAMQRINPSGVEARAMIADIAGQKIHDRSGAAVTVGEAERLKPYIPNVNDNAETVKKKLALFQREYVAMQRELLGGRSVADAARGATGATGGWSIQEVR